MRMRMRGLEEENPIGGAYRKEVQRQYATYTKGEFKKRL